MLVAARLAMFAVALVGGDPGSSSRNGYELGDVGRRGRAFFDASVGTWVGSIVPKSQGNGWDMYTRSVDVFGYRRFPFGVGMAFGFSERIIAGIRLDASIEPDRLRSPSRVDVRGALQPFVELLFARSREVRPFAMARAGLGIGHAFVVRKGDVSPDERTPVFVYPTVGIGAGAHAFVLDDLSVTAMITVDHRWNVRRGSKTPPDRPYGGEGWSYRDGELDLAIAIGLSRWF